MKLQAIHRKIKAIDISIQKGKTYERRQVEGGRDALSEEGAGAEI